MLYIHLYPRCIKILSTDNFILGILHYQPNLDLMTVLITLAICPLVSAEKVNMGLTNGRQSYYGHMKASVGIAFNHSLWG